MTQETEAQLTDRKERRQYELALDGKLAAHIAYRMRGDDTIDLVHTEVDPRHEGKGLASRIVKFALDDARSRGLKVLASCSYVAGWIARHPEYGDLQSRPA